MKKFLISGIFVLLMSIRALALDVIVPEDKIVGSEKLVALGEVVRLSLPKLDTSVKYLSNRAIDWKVFDGDVEKQFIADGENIILGTGITAKKFKVMAAVSYLYLVKDEKTNAVTQVEVRTRLLTDFLKVGTELPPTPPIPPAPVVLPKGKFDVSQKVYNNTYSLVTDVNRVAQAQKLADSYTGISSAIASGGIKTGADALKAVTEQNKLALGASTQAWDVYFSTLADVIYPMYQNRQIVTVQDFKALFDEISLGLKAVK